MKGIHQMKAWGKHALGRLRHAVSPVGYILPTPGHSWADIANCMVVFLMWTKSRMKFWNYPYRKEGFVVEALDASVTGFPQDAVQITQRKDFRSHCCNPSPHAERRSSRCARHGVRLLMQCTGRPVSPWSFISCLQRHSGMWRIWVYILTPDQSEHRFGHSFAPLCIWGVQSCLNHGFGAPHLGPVSLWTRQALSPWLSVLLCGNGTLPPPPPHLCSHTQSTTFSWGHSDQRGTVCHHTNKQGTVCFYLWPTKCF